MKKKRITEIVVTASLPVDRQMSTNCKTATHAESKSCKYLHVSSTIYSGTAKLSSFMEWTQTG